MIINLEEIGEKIGMIKDKIDNIDNTIKVKIDDLQKLLESSDSKAEMLALIEELSTDIDQDSIKLQDALG